ncbi:MAG: DUF512 domain-containing protein [Actinomycetota bacterium]
MWDRYPELRSVAVVPLGVSDHSDEPEMRPHTPTEAAAVIDEVERWQQIFLDHLGHRMVHVGDEYYLLAGRPFPPAEIYDGFAMHEDGIGMARTFEAEFLGLAEDAVTPAAGFFSWVDGAPAEGYRAPRLAAAASGGAGGHGGGCGVALAVPGQPAEVEPGGGGGVAVQLGRTRRGHRPIGILTGALGAQVLAPLVEELGRDDVRLIPVENRFFGGNIGVTGLMVGEDVARHLSTEPADHRFLLPDVCLSGGRFLDGMTVDDLPRPVEVVSTDGISLRRVLDGAA